MERIEEKLFNLKNENAENEFDEKTLRSLKHESMVNELMGRHERRLNALERCVETLEQSRHEDKVASRAPSFLTWINSMIIFLFILNAFGFIQ